MSLNLKTDYSFLFSGMSGQKSVSGNFLGINLSEYASIKSGAYSKALKSYYAQNAGSDDDSTGTRRTNSRKNSTTGNVRTETDNSKKALSQIKNDSGDLKAAADKLSVTGTNSLFNKKDITTTAEDGTKTTTKDYDKNAIYSAVNQFAKEYNALLDSASSSAAGNNTSRTLSNMKNLTDVFKDQLSKVGVTVGSNGKLSVDEEAFKNADMTKVKGLFNGANSYASNIGGYASSISSYAQSDLKFGSTYSASGTYNPFESGINYTGLF